MWLTMTYLLHTVGELLLSPVGLSAMTKLAPVRIAGLDDGHLVPRDLGRQLHRRPGLRPLRVVRAADAVRRGRPPSRASPGLVMFALTPSIKKMMGRVN